ncbi:hypothetical protein [Amycolatopsis sp. H20-H5]|uniref:hypothetical protein n=1 Tax=Amycolatopsis sp. H20-H5 TaxID=3046309 RepID=UPI002DBA0415|nr:hypothetical protein [Amycolatopsis sp. H20-H5]MEC3981288.1 hypothetical protein [Amycolatopsis sp. H20-H5]
MRTAVKLGLFAGALAIVFGAAWALGSLAGPGGTSPRDTPSHEAPMPGMTMDDHR